jgi:hypothetical protein
MGSHAGRPRDHTSTKQDLRCDAQTLAFQEIVKGLITEKEETNAKREERRHQKKYATMVEFLDLQKRALEV